MKVAVVDNSLEGCVMQPRGGAKVHEISGTKCATYRGCITLPAS